MNIATVMEIAKRYVGEKASGSTNLCYADAVRCNDAGMPYHAAIHAMRSLAHSVGILHADYSEAWKHCGQKGEPRLPGYLWDFEGVDATKYVPQAERGLSIATMIKLWFIRTKLADWNRLTARAVTVQGFGDYWIYVLPANDALELVRIADESGHRITLMN